VQLATIQKLARY